MATSAELQEFPLAAIPPTLQESAPDASASTGQADNGVGTGRGVTTIDARRGTAAPVPREQPRQQPTPAPSPPRQSQRQRNRLAASKSRRKRTQAILELEADERVAGARRSALAASESALEMQASELRRLLHQHTDCECESIRSYFEVRRRLGLDDGQAETAPWGEGGEEGPSR